MLKASVIIPTYRRDELLRRTLCDLIDQNKNNDYEIIVVDQKPNHTDLVKQQLEAWNKDGCIKYISLNQAGLNYARNEGAQAASAEIMIFLDDDVIIGESLVSAHVECYQDKNISAVMGDVISERDPKQDEKNFSLWGMNFSIRKSVFNEVGKMDEKFGIHSYFCDTCLEQRLRINRKKISFCKKASLEHLVAAKGGVRITDEASTESEWKKAFAPFYYFFKYKNYLTLKQKIFVVFFGIRIGPLRKMNVIKFWRQPKAWMGLFKAVEVARQESVPYGLKR